MDYDKKYMARCLELGKNGIGTSRPNPSVGAVIVHHDKIIGEGFTDPYGGPHAEVNAVNSVKDESLLKEATIYVTLEPCSHHGKTPPCADLIIRKQIPNVVIGTVDTNSLVFGEGIKRLEKAGCNVKVGVLEDECKQHHKRFFTVQNKQRPYIILKWAETNNGFIAPESKEKQEPVWISNAYAKQLVHKWRSEEHAILVGTNTVVADNPKLNVRHWTGNNPTRIVLDKSLRIPNNLSVLDRSILTIVLTEKEQDSKENITFERIDFSKELASQICDVLSKYKIQSVIIEGGTQTLQSFINENLWDEARVFVGEISFTKGVKAPVLKQSVTKEEKIKNNTLRYFFND
ncbi:bifunctional diaminohydroxyphosphoribosylaminopyrimidine deaminase/5-amino-6-(5-phosphoribosylamino)uracil reductase RibD [Tenacibaculum jejuense]|uniref:Riboflavin biosynthesis protein RibD n=1 Tax=Tenacibaculum jejuense TaxID=584609 RepID=A0A238U9L0_9FLAO|nr:bifunctional diaminohydroxyphosphoribosylaminopyrimidine deaminase/5-amino-6-(5-phosphoribosylamino)uracil reductase RibD [Tenacibaculum jejuense]SNR15745.1 Riboflavin biosynthesis protein RibD [Includes: Diaminohydroxyphosphoribosylaminopyrimidine deaminase; 5-amino-6-(5-phosphoribosylamino)uracil reductase] [Tenacibaculum jejuense]